MNKDEQKQFGKRLAATLVALEQDSTLPTVMVYLELLESYSLQECIDGLKKAVSCLEYKLTPSKVIDAMGQSPEELEMEARKEWIEFRNAVVSRPNPKFDNVVTAYIAQKIINIFECKNMTDEQFYRKENAFIKAYITGDKIVPDIKAQCLRGEIKTITESAMEWLHDEENKRLGLGDGDQKEIGE
jgi:hypothetical protein